MKEILVIKNFTANGKSYIAGDVITGLNCRQIAKLNEYGYIKPLTYEDLVKIKRELEQPKKKEEKQWQI